MNCENCGANVSEHAKFCRSCGGSVKKETITKEETIAREETAVTEERVGMQQPLTEEKSEELEKIKGYGEEFLKYIINVIKKPIFGKQELRGKLSQNKVLIFLPIMILINAFIVSLQLKLVQNSLANISLGFWDMRDFMGGLNYINPKEIIKHQFLLLALFFIIVGLGIFLVYQLLMKMDINFIDTLRMALNTTIILTISNGIAWILGLMSIKLLVLTMVVAMLLFMVMIVVQVIGSIGMKAKVIYTIPVIYLLSLYLTLNLYVKIF